MPGVTDGPMRSPLHAEHTRLGARFVDFAGWSMPVHYGSTLSEHRAVRSAAGVFDVSHLGRFHVEGEGATDVLSRVFCNDVRRIDPGRAQYTMMLTAGGGVVDDLIVWRLDAEDYWVLPNGANYETVLAGVAGAAPKAVAVSGARERSALVAVQGPQAPDLLERVLGWRPRRFRVARVEWNGRTLLAAGTGYTGERGAEIMIDAADAPALFDAVVDAGAAPCGLGARDTLRLEMGYALWGQDLDTSTTPLEADLAWVVAWDHEFVGKPALERQRAESIPKRLIGFAFSDRTIPRHGHLLRCGTGAGRVTSGNFSPTLGTGIGMGYVEPDPGEHPTVDVRIRGAWTTARRVTPPFVET
jgi:aminomethyltransferase